MPETALTMNEYQALATVTLNRDLSHRDRVANLAMGIAGEAGETADLIKKHLYHGHDLDVDKLKSELGDVMWYVATLSQTVGLTLDEVAAYNVAKLKNRYPEGFDKEKSKIRKD